MAAATDNAESSVTPTPKSTEEVTLQDQSTRLPRSRLVLVCASLILSIFLTSLEQTSVSTALPAITADVGSPSSSAWIGTAFLIGNTASQAVYARLSDIFGRKPMHLFGLGMFCIGSLLCGFSRSMAQLIAFRGIAGFGGGGILVCVMTIMSDLVSLKNRGKIQGVVGIGTILANGVGPTLGGVFAENDWRWIFWVVCPPAALAFVQTWLWLPLKPVEGEMKEKLKKIDYLGIFCQLVAIIFILIPISGGGSSFAWDSAESISFLVIGAVFFILFLVVEGFYAKLPVVPLYLFKDRSLSLLALATFCTGAYFFSAAYYLPIFFQTLRNDTPIVSSGLLQSLILTQVVTIFFGGFFLSWYGRYNPILWAGYGTYLVGAGMQTRFNASTSTGYIVGTLIIEGFGMGWTLQTSLVAMQANASHQDRAVVTSVRNIARFIGGSFGLAICSGILNNSGHVSTNGKAKLSALELRDQQNGLQKIWWFLFAIGVAVFLAGFGVKEVSMDKKEEPEANRDAGELGNGLNEKATDEEAGPVGK